MSGSKHKKIKKDGNRSVLDESYLDPRNAKTRITTFVDGDILDWLRHTASDEGLKYQSLLNKILRNAKDHAERPSKQTTIFHQKLDLTRFTNDQRAAIHSVLKEVFENLASGLSTRTQAEPAAEDGSFNRKNQKLRRQAGRSQKRHRPAS